MPERRARNSSAHAKEGVLPTKQHTRSDTTEEAEQSA